MKSITCYFRDLFLGATGRGWFLNVTWSSTVTLYFMMIISISGSTIPYAPETCSWKDQWNISILCWAIHSVQVQMGQVPPSKCHYMAIHVSHKVQYVHLYWEKINFLECFEIILSIQSAIKITANHKKSLCHTGNRRFPDHKFPLLRWT